MSDQAIAAVAFTGLTAIAVAFQVALAAGAPWGNLAMGGRYPGRFPLKMRMGAIIQAAILGVFALIVLVRAGMVLPEWRPTSRIGIWICLRCGRDETIKRSGATLVESEARTDLVTDRGGDSSKLTPLHMTDHRQDTPRQCGEPRVVELPTHSGDRRPD